MKVFGRTGKQDKARTQDDCDRVIELMAGQGVGGGHGVTVVEACNLLDDYDWAVAHDGWRDRVMSDAGETAAGMVVAVGACVSLVVFMATFGSIFGLVS